MLKSMMRFDLVELTPKVRKRSGEGKKKVVAIGFDVYTKSPIQSPSYDGKTIDQHIVNLLLYCWPFLHVHR